MWQVELGTAAPDNVFMGLAELDRQLSTLESLIGQERPNTRDQWRRSVHCSAADVKAQKLSHAQIPTTLCCQPGPIRKIMDLKNESEFFKGVVNRHVKSRTREQREVMEREELLARRNAVSGAFYQTRLEFERDVLGRCSMRRAIVPCPQSRSKEWPCRDAPTLLV